MEGTGGGLSVSEDSVHLPAQGVETCWCGSPENSAAAETWCVRSGAG